MIRESFAKLTIGTAGGALIEGLDQAAQVAAPVVADATGSADPIVLVKLITQIVVALATVISLFIKPKPKNRPADPAPEPIQPLRTLDIDADQPSKIFSRAECIFNYCPNHLKCLDRCSSPMSKPEQ